jgi:hypothetical protein
MDTWGRTRASAVRGRRLTRLSHGTAFDDGDDDLVLGGGVRVPSVRFTKETDLAVTLYYELLYHILSAFCNLVKSNAMSLSLLSRSAQ